MPDHSWHTDPAEALIVLWGNLERGARRRGGGGRVFGKGRASALLNANLPEHPIKKSCRVASNGFGHVL